MRLWATLVLFFVILAVAHPAWAQEPPKPSEKQTAAPTETNETPEVSPPAGNPASTAPTSVVLREGTVVKLKLLHTLNTKTVVLDDPLNFSVAEDVVVDGKSVVKAGAAAIGRVRQAKPARTMGRGAELGLEMQYMKAGRIRVPLRGSQVREGAGKTGETVALVVIFGLSGFVKHGSEIAVKEGSLFTAYVDQDTNVTAPPGPSGAGTGSVSEKEHEMNIQRLAKELVSPHSVVVLAVVFAMEFTAGQEPSPSAAGMEHVKVFVFVQRTDRHGKYSSSEVFHNAINDLLEYLKGKNVAIAVDEFGGRTYAESATPMETVFNIARDAKARSVLYVMVDRPKTKWIQITAQCYDMSGNQVWKEEASNGNGDMSGGHGLKTAEKRMREKLEKHVGKEGLPVVGSKEAVGEKK